jgi:hypothetical protein
LNSRQGILLVTVVVIVVGAGVTSALYVFSIGRSTSSSRPLPPGCEKPVGGFLIIASNTGFNDSMLHGAPSKTWPIITVHQNQTVNITVCNTDVVAHGFQVSHYYDSSIVTLTPGQVIHVSFVANEVGNFRIYCSIFCPIHIYMQNGELQVTT